MRSAYAIYRTLAKYVEIADAAAPAGHDATVDEDFRSGVLLGNGMISLILSLLPSAVLGVMAVFGFTGDRDYGLQMLMRAGGWKAGRKEPSVEPENEGLRRSGAFVVLHPIASMLTHSLCSLRYDPSHVPPRHRHIPSVRFLSLLFSSSSCAEPSLPPPH